MKEISVPTDGKLYWQKPAPEDEILGCHSFLSWDAKAGRYQESIEPAGCTKLKSRYQGIPRIPPRLDGTILREGVGYDPINLDA